MAEETVYIAQLETEFGNLGALMTSQGLARLTLPNQDEEELHRWIRRYEPQAEVCAEPYVFHPLLEQLYYYLDGNLMEFYVPLDLRGTEFQLKVWEELQNIPYGQVCTYADIAHRLGNPRAARAVSQAVAANPIPIIIPCHRVIGKDGSLSGYVGGVAFKQRLMHIEGIFIPYKG